MLSFKERRRHFCFLLNLRDKDVVNRSARCIWRQPPLTLGGSSKEWTRPPSALTPHRSLQLTGLSMRRSQKQSVIVKWKRSSLSGKLSRGLPVSVCSGQTSYWMSHEKLQWHGLHPVTSVPLRHRDTAVCCGIKFIRKVPVITDRQWTVVYSKWPEFNLPTETWPHTTQRTKYRLTQIKFKMYSWICSGL